MSHEFEHIKSNEKLRDLLTMENLDVELSYDGLKIPIKLKSEEVNKKIIIY